MCTQAHLWQSTLNETTSRRSRSVLRSVATTLVSLTYMKYLLRIIFVLFGRCLKICQKIEGKVEWRCWICMKLKRDLQRRSSVEVRKKERDEIRVRSCLCRASNKSYRIYWLQNCSRCACKCRFVRFEHHGRHQDRLTGWNKYKCSFYEWPQSKRNFKLSAVTSNYGRKTTDNAICTNICCYRCSLKMRRLFTGFNYFSSAWWLKNERTVKRKDRRHHWHLRKRYCRIYKIC